MAPPPTEPRGAHRGAPGHPDGPGPDAGSSPGIHRRAFEHSHQPDGSGSERERFAGRDPVAVGQCRQRRPHGHGHGARRRRGGRERELRHHRPGQRADCSGPRDAVPAHRPERADARRVRLHDGQLRQPGRLRPGHDPEPGHRRAVGLRATGHHPGHAARRGPGRAGAARGRRRHARLRLQRHQPDPGRRHPQRPAAGQLRQRAWRLDLRPGLVLQRHPVLPGRGPGRGSGQADDSGGRHGQRSRA